MSGDIFKKVMAYAQTAPQAFTGYGPSPQFGKATMTPYVVAWKKGGAPDRIPLAEWEGDIGRNQMELVFEVDIQEFNPGLTFNYSRKVRVEVNKVGKNGQVEQKTDWSEIVLPSLVAVFGDNWANEINGTYVEVVDEESHDKPYQKKDPVTRQPMFDEKGEPVMTKPNTVKFLNKFANKEVCLAAHNARYSGTGKDVDASASQIPADVVAGAKSLRASMGDDAFKNQFANQEPFKNYNVDALMAASNPL